MGQRCNVCKHSERLHIDRQIVNGVPHLKIANRYGLSPASVCNHAKEHLSRQMLKSQEIAEKASADVLMGEIDTCLNKAKNILRKAEDDGKPSLQLQAIREIRQTIEFLSKLAISLAQMKQEQERLAGDSFETVIILPPKLSIEEGRVEDSIQQRRTRKAKTSAAERVIHSMQEEEEPGILDWEPDIPKKESVWGRR